MTNDQPVFQHQADRLADRALGEAAGGGDIRHRHGTGAQCAQHRRVAGAIVDIERAITLGGALIDEFADITEEFAQTGPVVDRHER
ncbi:hypothetical protein D3C80_1026370 [compost metagenome]